MAPTASCTMGGCDGKRSTNTDDGGSGLWMAKLIKSPLAKQKINFSELNFKGSLSLKINCSKVSLSATKTHWNDEFRDSQKLCRSVRRGALLAENNSLSFECWLAASSMWNGYAKFLRVSGWLRVASLLVIPIAWAPISSSPASFNKLLENAERLSLRTSNYFSARKAIKKPPALQKRPEGFC